MEQGKDGGIWKGPCGTCVAHGESCIQEDGKALCDGYWKRKVACDLSGRSLCGAKVKWKGRSIINSNKDTLGKLEPKRRKVSPVLVIKIQQLAGTSLSLYQDLISVL